MRPIVFRQTNLSKLLPYFKFLTASILILLFLKAFIIDVYRIPTQSMQPTLFPGEHVLNLKIIYGVKVPWTNIYIRFSSPKHSDVVAFQRTSDKTFYIKRILGTPGDVVEFRNNEFVVSGTVLKKKYFTTTYIYKYVDNSDVVFSEIHGKNSYTVSYSNQQRTSNMQKPYTCSNVGYFVAGDNRTNSIDSRKWGEITGEEISSKVIMIWFSFDADKNKIRWNRIGKIIH